MQYRRRSLLSIVGVAATLLASVNSFALANENQTLAQIVTVDGDVESKYNDFVEKKIKTIGFVLTDPHKRVNDGYKKKYGSTKLDILSFMSISNKKVMSTLLEIDPRLAGFNPFNMLIYRAIGDKSTHIGHLDPVAILDMIGIKDTTIRKEYPKMIAPLDDMIKREFGDNVSTIKIKSMVENRMMNFEVSFERPDDLDDFIDSFQEKFEEAFEDKEYIIAGFFNYKESFDGVDRLPSYDAFWVYSLCHFKFSYTVFDNEGGRPEAGLFAPCSMYMFIKKDTNKLVIGMPRLANWAATLGIEDRSRLALVKQLDREIPEIMKTLGAKEVPNVNPLTSVAVSKKETSTAKAEMKPKAIEKKESKRVQDRPDNSVIIDIPSVPKPVEPVKVITRGGNAPVKQNESMYKPRSIDLKVSTPPKFVKSAKTNGENDKDVKVGEVKNNRVSSYLRGDLQSVESVKKSLSDAGFTILSETKVDKSGKLTSIVFTNKALREMADKKNRGFVASLRVLVNEKDKEISFSNPLYLARAFMQDDFDKKAISPVLESIREAFPKLHNCKDVLKYNLLPKYHFMTAMPYYQDMVTVAEADSTKDLLEKAIASKKVVFTQQLSKDRFLIGVKLGKRTSKFIKKIGTRNAGLLPYPIIIEDGKAKIMDPKYYIAIMYPALKMSEFMTISTVPGAIEVDTQNIFR
ncbi:hypothetical protein MNB_SV-6-353 [hydrothermal vent metagenome]|uniref:Uncharacterized protein n=1 Tax=hydrothermal vent metagenome TaxID=652676 RepID=A0A1W1C8N4_9ZZZZ